MNMENSQYYRDLAERIFFYGIESTEVPSFATYRPNKSFQDLKSAFLQGRSEGTGQFEREIGCIARRLYEVLEIQTEAYAKKYREPDLWMVKE